MNSNEIQGLIGGLVGAGIAIFVTIMFWVWVANITKEKNAREKLSTSIGTAKVLEVGHSSLIGKSTGNRGLILVALRVEVAPSASSSYSAITRWSIEPAHLTDVQVGKTIPVKIDSMNPKILFPDVLWAKQPSINEATEDDMYRGSNTQK